MTPATDCSKLFVLLGSTGALRDMVQTLRYEVLAGDLGLFMRVDQIEAACTLLQLLLDAWVAYPAVYFPQLPRGQLGLRVGRGTHQPRPA
jgi:hypothetical protein